jgi:hypothetical protein
MSSPAITCTPAAPAAAVDFCRLDVAYTHPNTLVGYSALAYPASPEVRYYLNFVEGGVEYGRSPVFSTSEPDEAWVFNNYMFPHAGTWTVGLYTTADVETATLSVTVS